MSAQSYRNTSNVCVKKTTESYVFFQDYESKLEALQKQVDSRYLESPEEEEEPEEEGGTVTFLN